MFRLICSLLVVLVCGVGYMAFGHDSGASQGSSDASSSQQQAAPAAPSQDDSQFKDLKVN